MESNKNPIRGIIVDVLNRFTRDKKNTNYDKILIDFKIMLEDSSLVDKIRNDNELSNRVYEIYNVIKDNYINE